MTSTVYTRDILRLATAIPHLGRLPAPHGSAERHSPVCGSRVAVDVMLDGSERIDELGLSVQACALGQASAALLGTHALGANAGELAEARGALAEYLVGTCNDPGTWPGLNVFAGARALPARHASILLVFDAALEAVRIAQGEG